MKEGTEEYINAMKAMGKIQQTKEQVEKNPLMTAFTHALATGDQKKINELAKKINSNGDDNGNVMDTVIDELKDNWKTAAEIGGGYLLYRGAKSEFTNRVFNDKPGAPTKIAKKTYNGLGRIGEFARMKETINKTDNTNHSDKSNEKTNITSDKTRTVENQTKHNKTPLNDDSSNATSVYDGF